MGYGFLLFLHLSSLNVSVHGVPFWTRNGLVVMGHWNQIYILNSLISKSTRLFNQQVLWLSNWFSLWISGLWMNMLFPVWWPTFRFMFLSPIRCGNFIWLIGILSFLLLLFLIYYITQVLYFPLKRFYYEIAFFTKYVVLSYSLNVVSTLSW